MTSRPAQATLAARFAHSNPSLGNPIPMDIDATWKAKATPNTCRCCRKTGHWTKDCDLRFDVWYMDADELETELENKLAAKDVAPMETSEEAEPSAKSSTWSWPKVPAKSTEGHNFQTNQGYIVGLHGQIKVFFFLKLMRRFFSVKHCNVVGFLEWGAESTESLFSSVRK